MLSADAFSAFEDAGLDDNKVSPKELYGKIGLHSLAIYLNNFFFCLIYFHLHIVYNF